MPFSPSSFGGLPGIVEQMSETPQVSPTTQPTEPGITPGGLATTDNVPTLGKMQSGSLVAKLVVLIEGVDEILSDCNDEAALQLALKGTDWEASTSQSGLFVSLQNSQSITPDKPFATNGRCSVRVVDTDGTDAFGTMVNRRAAGAQTTLTATIDRNDTTINVASTASFGSTGTIYIGTERITYTGKTATSFTGCVRGMYSPFGCDATGTGGSRFANHHRIAVDTNHVQLNPVVSEEPRVWIGKRCGVWLHTWNEATGALNTHANAQLVYAGRIVGISDDPDTFHTVLELDHESQAFTDAVIGKDMLVADIAPGMWIAAGRKFSFKDTKGTTTLTATSLTVVSSGAAGSSQMNEGFYSLDSLCEKFNTWLSGEKVAGRIYGYYTWHSPVTSNVGLRTKCYWQVEDASSLPVTFRISLPGEVNAFLGLSTDEPITDGMMYAYAPKPGKLTNVANLAEGQFCPFQTLIFKPQSAGRTGQEYTTEAINYDLANERGQFADQRSLMPAAIRESCPASSDWGLFLLDDRALVVGSYANNRITNCWLAPYQLTADNNTEALGYIGLRADETPAPVTIRQIFIFEDTFENIVNTLAFSTGTSGYSHELDTLGYGLGLNMPGELLSDEWKRSISNLPGADTPMAIVIDEPTKFSELMGDDFRLRRVFVRWKDRHFEFCRWRTPLVANATVTLSEANKAAPAGQEENHRIASQETDEWQYPIVKVDYARDFAVGRNGQYLRSVQLEDQTAVDDGGGTGRSMTLKMRNTFAQWANTGAGVEALFPEYIATMPMFSKAARRITRSIDLRYFEGVSVGDIAVVTDSFARDPLTGQRGINARAAMVTRHSYDLGGPDPKGGESRPMGGEIELFFLDVQRGSQYVPCANIDYDANYGGFSAGYKSSTATIRCRPHDYSHVLTVIKRGMPVSVAEDLDASNLAAGYVCDITERDPVNPAAPVTWRRTVESVDGNDVVWTVALSAPAWDATKKYRITFAPYTSCVADQQDFAFQADDADEMIQDQEVPYHLSSDEELFDAFVSTTADKAELIPELSYGDGKGVDVGIDRQLGINANAITDYITAHQSPWLDSGSWDIFGKAISGTWYLNYIGPKFFGTEHLSTTVGRSVAVAPAFYSSDGTSVSVRVTISDSMPVVSPASTITDQDVRYVGNYSQATFTTTSTTLAVAPEQLMTLCKDMFWGVAFVCVEVNSNKVRFAGLSKFLEGPRVVT